MAGTNTIQTHNSSLPRALRAAVIYGANASGKSNLIRALQLMRGVVLESAASQPNHMFNVQPFRLDQKSAAEPTFFEVTVLLDGTRYQYGFEFISAKIISEWLLVYQKSKPQKWFYRKIGINDSKDTFEFGPHLLGAKRVWQEATRPNALFLSTAVQLNSESLAPLYNWFSETLKVFLDGGQISPDFSTGLIQTVTGQNKITSLLSRADIAIKAISAVPTKGYKQSITFDPLKGTADTKLEEAELLLPRFKHTIDSVSADFELSDESQGTQKLFALAGPILDILEHGRILVIDELDRSLHPLLVRQIIDTFQNPDLNCNGAQLIFTTHDTSQLDTTLLRRDQIWLTEKRRNHSSELVPLMEFSPRKSEALEKGYLSGRYGGVPVIATQLIDESDCAER
ncbi:MULTISPECIES: AAA family ATPase [Acidiphilium]|uniref:AAA family ATPase n=1 Tax=Acidiphilium TaxID=522 RepID=UPI001B8051B3|nr:MULTISPECIES: ATP-binding protein [Acidiphilium]